VLLGGSPLRLVRLVPATAKIAMTLFGGASIAETAEQHGQSVSAVARLVRRLLLAGLADPAFKTQSVARDITVVIPIRDRPEELARLLVALLTTKAQQPARIVVVDDGSSSDLSTIIDGHGAGITMMVSHLSSLGPAAARNTGLAEASTSLVAFVDSDVVPTDGWMSPLLAHFADPAVVLVAPRVRSAPGHSSIAKYEMHRSPLDLGSGGGYVFARSRVAYLPAATLIARTEVLQSIGGFDASLRVGEDVDLVWRLVEAGHLVRYEPGSIVEHDPRPSLHKFAEQRASYGGSSATLNKRHHGNVRPVSANRWSYLVWLLAALGGWPGVAAGTTVAAITSALLPKKLTVLKGPRPVGLNLALKGHLGLGRLLANATWRAWLPIISVLSISSKRARRVLLASAVIPGWLDWHERRPDLDPLRWIALRCLDDAAYCAGVWQGCWRDRNIAAVLPDIQNWPSDLHTEKDGEHGSAV
jgi:mycofactocin glycosyltransferase